jgi:type I restriction enzyme S subunit
MLNRNYIAGVQIIIPEISEQRAIASVLGVLDNKMESNARIAERISALIAAHISSAADGGESVPVSSLARFVNGGAYTKGASGEGRIVIRIAELNSGPGPSTVYNDIEVPVDKTASAGDILMAW